MFNGLNVNINVFQMLYIFVWWIHDFKQIIMTRNNTHCWKTNILKYNPYFFFRKIDPVHLSMKIVVVLKIDTNLKDDLIYFMCSRCKCIFLTKKCHIYDFGQPDRYLIGWTEWRILNAKNFLFYLHCNSSSKSDECLFHLFSKFCRKKRTFIFCTP